MEAELKHLLDVRRAEAGSNGKPLSYRKYADILGVNYNDLFKFMTGLRGMAIPTIRKLAKKASQKGDKAMILALAEYALDVSLEAE